MDTSPSPVAAPRRTRRQWTPQSHAEHYIGRNLDEGRFVIRSLIAQGGMADVFLADDRRDGRPVAIKILRADDVDSEEGRRFAWEVRMLANLQHPNLVAVHATGTTEEGNPYMVQPYLGGDTLRARLAGGPLGWRVALEIGVQIADVLQCLHEAGVVHRDVKIDNIIWARHSTQPVWVKLIDLGIAKLLGWVPPPIEAALPLDQRATKIGHVLGTDGYRPPEALEGICTPRFDIFSLGVTLYRLCANAMPEPEVRPLAEVCPGWDGPAEFESAIRKAMDPDPERRFASAEALRLTLEAIRSCNPDPDRPRHLFAGRFDLLRPLGSGAKATTYAAYDRELEATAAIKILSAASQADPDECLRFIREAMILRHVRHPNLPAFFELGTHAGQRYLAMELCPGKRAREYTLPTTCLRPAEVVRIGEQLASALKALGEAGVIYRDLTHDNVLIHFDDRDPRVKLIDFNASLLIEDRFYARLDERWARPPEQRLRPNRELGLQTMSYAAPEVRAGAPWSEASDVFALGRLLYLLLTGQEPFPCAVPKGTMAPPWREDCPENLLMALESALAIDPAERGTVGDIIDFLSGAREEIEQDEKAARTRSARNTEPEPIERGEPLARASASPAATAAPAPAAPLRAEQRNDAGSELEDATTLEPSVIAAREPAVVSRPAAWRSRWALGVLGVLAAAAVLVVRSLLPGEPAADDEAAALTEPEPVAAEPPRVAHPPGEPADPPPASLVAVDPVLDMEDTLAHVDEELRACARTAGRRITVDLAVSANGTRFDSIVILPAEANVDRCVRELLEPLRFRAYSSATTFIKRSQPSASTPTAIAPPSASEPATTTTAPPAPSGTSASGEPLEAIVASPAEDSRGDELIRIDRHPRRSVRPAEGQVAVVGAIPARPGTAPTATLSQGDRPTLARPGRGLLIAGGLSLVPASVLAGLAAYSAVRVERLASTYGGLAETATGQGYTDPDVDMMRRDLEQDGPHWRRVRIGTSIAAGLVTGAAVALITAGAVKRRRSLERLTLHPLVPGLLMTARF